MKELVMINVTKDDYFKFIVNFGIIPTLILIDKFEKLELYEECSKIVKAIDAINKKVKVYKETRLTESILNEVVEDYRKLGIEDMNKEKLIERCERYASMFILENSYIKYRQLA
jgi:hypothetical protein